ncbi:NADH-ubiquinone oxidoreductase chain J [hydrothermal vent metagenome]|uniref:NADH-ubiquinone oxidoreductase chain J n=1 Tax=hydrothermal vent metagenome TaxID=652676 RepID=A0A3B1DC57_9ZZZZ
MSGEAVLFWFFAFLACGGAVAVVITQNVVRMAFCLIIALGSVSALFFLANADFVAAAQLIIYVGGTVILLIFGVMLTATGPQSKIKTSPAELLVAAGIGALFLTMLVSTVASVDWDSNRIKLVDITPAKFHEVQKVEGSSVGQLLEKSYSFNELRNVYELKTKKLSPSSSELQQLNQLWVKHGLQFAPHSKNGGTARPLGMSFLGVRPDRNLGESSSQIISPGFVMPARKTIDGKTSSLSVGYLLPFEIISIHLLVVLIGASYLARAKRRTQVSEED